MRVVLYCDFIEDQRTSMDGYALNLIESLDKNHSDFIEIDVFKPLISPWVQRLPERLNLKMRAARYIDYPLQVKNISGEINHILDHGYAHLLAVLDPDKTVVTVHDIIPIMAGMGKMSGVKPLPRAWLSEFTARFYKKARWIIAISESTKRDLVNYCGCDPKRIKVVYYGLNKSFVSTRDNSISKATAREKLGLPTDEVKLILITGRQFYKNHKTCIKVFSILKKKYGKSIKLVRLSADNDEWRRLVVEHSVEEDVINIDYLAPDQMPLIYSAVDCLLFPSLYEGFGWPPIEAMACGTPVVCSNVASLPESVGDAALYCEPEDVDGLVQATESVLTDESLRKGMVDKGFVHIKRFDWTENAKQVMDIYQSIHNGDFT